MTRKEPTPTRAERELLNARCCASCQHPWSLHDTGWDAAGCMAADCHGCNAFVEPTPPAPTTRRKPEGERKEEWVPEEWSKNGRGHYRQVKPTLPEPPIPAHRCSSPTCKHQSRTIPVSLDVLREVQSAMEFLMGGPGWEKGYECGHGAAITQRCGKGCALNVVRATLDKLRAIMGDQR